MFGEQIVIGYDIDCFQLRTVPQRRKETGEKKKKPEKISTLVND